jgi:hypothetical protein
MPDFITTLNARTVLHGVSESVPSYSKLPAKGNYASRCMQEDVLGHVFYDPQERAWKPFAIIPFEFNALNRDPQGFNNSAIGWHDLGVVIPAGTIVMDAVVDVVEAFAGGGASVLFKFESAAGAAGDVMASTAVGSLTLGLKAVVSDGTAGNMKKATANRMLKAQVTGGTLTAGVAFGFLRCVNSWLARSIESSSSSSSSSSSRSSASSASSASSNSSSSRSSVSISTSSSCSSKSSVTSSSCSSSKSSATSSSSSSSNSSSSRQTSSSSSSS